MENVIAKYEKIALEERTLNQRIATCRDCISILLDYISINADSIHILTVEEIVSAIHAISQDLDTELLHLRLEKGRLEYKIKCRNEQ